MVIKNIIGLNYGDEGKGLMTDYFTHEAVSRGHKVLNILTNGSAQRGHTVELFDGTRHVFHHFGSGTFAGADTYCPSQFLINPIVFNQEYEDLNYAELEPTCFINLECKVVTPYHMLVNQFKETIDKKGSCGMGVWEAVKYSPLTMKDLAMSNIPNIVYKLRKIRYTLGDNKGLPDIFWNDDLLFGFVNDCVKFVDRIITVHKDNHLLPDYDTVIFENGQGLLLDQKLPDKDHLTPSNTGLTNVKEILGGHQVDEIETIYVTRSYMTRHGNGPFPEECDKSEINSNIVDPTNVPNEWQGSLRYGKLDLSEATKRIEKFGTTSLAITHINEYEPYVPDLDNVDKIYWSDSPTKYGIKIIS